MSYPNKAEPDPEIIQRAAALIRNGKLVAFPTETVYGLGANALDAGAVERIFRVKGRPASSPLIVHVHSQEAARDLVTNWPPAAEKLAREFWPGPLTIVLPKREFVPAIVTASLPTVGVRVPANAIALALLAEARLPIAAPSANRFTELSPTTAQHVRNSLGDAVDLILDGGRTDVGIESTVLSLAGPTPILLRPGMISAVQIEQVIGKIQVAKLTPDGPHPAPGMHERHYTPRTPLVLHLPGSGRGAYLWITSPQQGAHNVEMPADALCYAAILYDTLHRLDAQGFDWIAVEPPPDDAAWAGINDRLKRAESHF
ncbi:MAG: translation factor [Bryobacterales bacterium]|nr:translation factor [Bryobacterales bacterium]